MMRLGRRRRRRLLLFLLLLLLLLLKLAPLLLLQLMDKNADPGYLKGEEERARCLLLQVLFDLFRRRANNK